MSRSSVHAASIALLTSLLLSAAPDSGQAQQSDIHEESREQFLSGWHAAGRGQFESAERILDGLGDYPLAPYLRYELLRQRIDQTAPAEVSRFLETHRGWSFADALTRRWLQSMAHRGLDDHLLQHASLAESPETRCAIDRVRLARGQSDGLADRIRSLWLSPVSQPKACDPLFDWWRKQGNPSTDDAWTRFGLAIEAGETSLARYLRRYLDRRDRPLADAWLQLHRRPGDVGRIAGSWPDQERTRRLAAWALHRLASSDWSRALALEARLRNQFEFESEEIGPAARRIRLFQAVDLDPGAPEGIDALPPAEIDDALLAWRARVALAHAEWAEVLNSIYRMSADQQQAQRWRYWQARAMDALERPESDAIWKNLARETTYYGFLAALRLDQPLTLCSRELNVNGPIRRALHRDAMLERALELYRAGLGWHAPWTWQRAIAPLSNEEKEQAALMAAAEGWHDRVIMTLAQAEALNPYTWRFPLAWREAVQAAGRHHDVESALVFGLMRAESALQPDARSPAGARGLLQLMPGTARAVAQRHGLPYRRARDLNQPALNIDLGTAHLGELQQRFDGDWTRIAAAYNAGIRHAERWDRRKPDLPNDIWIETLSFHETRDYIPRVLVFATIYEWQLGQSAALLGRHLAKREARTAFSCPTRSSTTPVRTAP